MPIASLSGTSALLDGLSPTIPELLQTINELKERVSALESKNSVGPIAFSAGLRSTLEHVGDHQHIVFENVITNIGGGYNAIDGNFIAPLRGAYVFFVVLTNSQDHAASVQLLQNGQFLGQVLADDSSTGYVTSTLAMTTQLEAGDHVWVQNEYTFSTTEQIDGETGRPSLDILSNRIKHVHLDGFCKS